jgi:hypothetical protein
MTARPPPSSRRWWSTRRPRRRRRRRCRGTAADITSGTPVFLQGITLTLTGTTASGQSVTLTATTDANGFYSFGNLAAGTYSVSESVPGGYSGAGFAGTVNGNTDRNGNAASIVNISLAAGDQAVNYNFTDFRVSS